MTMIPPKIKKLPNLHKPVDMQKREPPKPKGSGLLNKTGQSKMRNS